MKRKFDWKRCCETQKRRREVEKMKKLMTVVLSVMFMAALCGTDVAGNIDSPGDPLLGGGGLILNWPQALTCAEDINPHGYRQPTFGNESPIRPHPGSIKLLCQLKRQPRRGRASRLTTPRALPEAPPQPPSARPTPVGGRNIEEGKIDRRSGAVIILDQNGSTEGARYQFPTPGRRIRGRAVRGGK